jgi:assimilatory nitrate reductase catalytic subunit
VSTETKTTCAYCGVGCGVVARVFNDGRITIQGDVKHPANYGRLCAKGAALGDTIDLHDRLVYPQVDGRRHTWVSALNHVANTFKETIEQHGPNSVAFYVSGQLLTEDYYVANKLMKGFIGSGNIDTNSRLCMASSVAGHKRAFGEDVVPGVYEDLELADLVVLTGSNLAWCHPVMHQRLLAAREAKGTKIVVIDPRATATTNIADIHLPLHPGSDVALFNGLLKYLVDNDAVCHEYIKQHCEGFEAAQTLANDYTVEQVCAITHLDSKDVIAFYKMFAETPATVSVYSQGVNQSSSGSDKVNSIINAHLATGRVGKPGSGPFSITGQPNAMGGRETGGLANTLAAHIDFSDEKGHRAVKEFWQAPALANMPGLKAVDLFEEISTGKVKALWIMATNPVVSMPSSDKIASAIEKCDFVVVSDIVARTATSSYANVLLPAEGWGEKDGTVTNSERCISRQRKFVRAPGEAKPDWWIICEIAKRMGFEANFSYSNSAAIFREYAKMTTIESSGPRTLDIGPLANLSDNAFDVMSPLQWPVKSLSHLTGNPPKSRLYTNGKYSTPNGKAKFVATDFRPPQTEVSADYPFRLNSGRIRDQWHTMTRSINAAQLGSHIAEPYVEINPSDAERLRVQPAELLTVFNQRKSVILRALVTMRVRPGDLFVPMHWSSEYASKAMVNELFASAVDPISGQPELKYSPANVKCFKSSWYGFAIVTEWRQSPNVAYWARMRTKTGWRVEMSDDSVQSNYEQFFDEICPVSGSVDLIQYSDRVRGTFRIAAIDAGVLVGAFFAAPMPVQVAREQSANLLGKSLDSADIAMLFTGNRAGKQFDEGPTICTCMGVGANTIKQAVLDGAASIGAVGEMSSAGTNCGSCRMEIQQIISTTQVEALA